MTINYYSQINSNKINTFLVQAENQRISSEEQTSAETTPTYCTRLCQVFACCFTAGPIEDTKNTMPKTIDDVDASSLSLLQSPSSVQREKKEILLRIHSVNSSSNLLLLYFQPGKPFFLKNENADLFVRKFSNHWKIIKFNRQLEEGLQKRIMNKAIDALKKTHIKVLLLPESCQNILPDCQGLTIGYFR